MTPAEFNQQVFRTAQQWKSGLLCKLELSESGITLFPAPTFIGWLETEEGLAGQIHSLAVNDCGLIYWIVQEGARWCLQTLDTRTGIRETVTCFDDCPGHGMPRFDPGAMWLDSFNLWVADRANRRILAFSLQSFQLKSVIEGQGEVIAGAPDPNARRLYVLHENETFRICAYRPSGRPIRVEKGGRSQRNCFGCDVLKDPVGLGVGGEHQIYALDREATGFHRFSPDGSGHLVVGRFDLIELPDGRTFQPSRMAVGPSSGNIFVVSDEETGPSLHQFDQDGSYLGEVQLPPLPQSDPEAEPTSIQQIRQMAFGPGGSLYLLTERGIARFGFESSPVGEAGVYYSPTLDNGRKGGQWHRLSLKADLPVGTGIEASYCASDQDSLKISIDRILSDAQTSIQEKKEEIERRLAPLWSEPQSFRERQADADSSDDPSARPSQADNPLHHMLFVKKTARYLWLKLELSSFDEKNKPVVEEMRVYHPRLSYLRYLPATYQADAVSQDFLERFLSLFETVFFDLDVEITELFRYFDPQVAPPGFLDWLSCWMNVALEEEWPEQRKRQLLGRAAELFKKKGTPAGLAAFIEILTGKRATVVEPSRLAKPMILLRSPCSAAPSFRLGIDSRVGRTPVRGFSLGEEAVVGRTALRSSVQRPEDPLLHSAHRFRVLLDMSREEYRQAQEGLQRALADHKPAHTQCSLHPVGEAALGQGSWVGFNTRLTEFQPFRLGLTATLGRSVALIQGEPGGRLERNSVLGTRLTLI